MHIKQVAGTFKQSRAYVSAFKLLIFAVYVIGMYNIW